MRQHRHSHQKSFAALLLRIAVCLCVLAGGWVQAAAIASTSHQFVVGVDSSHCHDGSAGEEGNGDRLKNAVHGSHSNPGNERHVSAQCCKAGACACTLTVPVGVPSLVVHSANLSHTASLTPAQVAFASAALAPPLDPPIS